MPWKYRALHSIAANSRPCLGLIHMLHSRLTARNKQRVLELERDRESEWGTNRNRGTFPERFHLVAINRTFATSSIKVKHGGGSRFTFKYDPVSFMMPLPTPDHELILQVIESNQRGSYSDVSLWILFIWDYGRLTSRTCDH